MNGAVIHTSTVAPTLPLYVDIAMSAAASTTGLSNIKYLYRSGCSSAISNEPPSDMAIAVGSATFAALDGSSNRDSGAMADINNALK